MAMTYGEQLRHPNWQRKRLERMQAANFECENCGDKETTLNVHHKRYVRGRKVWEYENWELEVLCENCHGHKHEGREIIDLMLCGTNVYLPDIAVMLQGFIEWSSDVDGEMLEAEETQVALNKGLEDGQTKALIAAGIIARRMSQGDDEASFLLQGEAAKMTMKMAPPKTPWECSILCDLIENYEQIIAREKEFGITRES
jgi:hypothetical protein